MKRTIAVLSIFAVFAVVLASGSAWAHEGRGGGGGGRCSVEKRYVDYRRPYVQQHYRREYVNQNNGNEGNHYGWVNNQPRRLGNLSAEQQTKVKEFWEKQKSERKSFLDSLKSQS